MGFFRQVKKWVSQIYLIEENDPVHGGENGITNRPIRELADRTEYLKAHLTPKSLGANSQNQSDNDGHEHELPKASTTQKGIVQLTSDTGLDSETLGLSAKAGKVLAQGIASLRLALNGYIPNSKKSDSVTSSSSDTVATSKAVKTAYDKGVDAKTVADNALRIANTKQSPATTLAGYGIGDFVIKSSGVSSANEIKTSGYYALAPSVQDKPTSSDFYILESTFPSEGVGYHLATKIRLDGQRGEQYIRHYFNLESDSEGQFSPWERYDSVMFSEVQQTPTTLAGYGITDSITVDDNFINTSLDTLLQSNSVWSVHGVSHSITGLPSNAYNYGVGLNLKSRAAIASIFIPHNNLTNAGQEMWIRTHYLRGASGTDYQPKTWTRVLTSGNVAVLTGWVGNGATLPLPQGFSESECKFFISPRRSMDLNRVNERNNYHAPFDFYIEGTRQVVARTYRKEGMNTDRSTGLKYDNATVNYLVIGIKS